MFVVVSDLTIKMEELALASFSASWTGEMVLNTGGGSAAQFLTLTGEGSFGLHEVLIPMVLHIQVRLSTVS